MAMIVKRKKFRQLGIGIQNCERRKRQAAQRKDIQEILIVKTVAQNWNQEA